MQQQLRESEQKCKTLRTKLAAQDEPRKKAKACTAATVSSRVAWAFACCCILLLYCCSRCVGSTAKRIRHIYLALFATGALPLCIPALDMSLFDSDDDSVILNEPPVDQDTCSRYQSCPRYRAEDADFILVSSIEESTSNGERSRQAKPMSFKVHKQRLTGSPVFSDMLENAETAASSSC